MNINQRILSELFVNKITHCNSDIYLKYFHRIWPSEYLFRGFLSANNLEEQIDWAKQIVLRLGFMSNIPIPYFLFQNLISVEHSGDDRPESGYVAQDHVVHSVNLYILGIYLFFSNSLFHSKLIRFFEGKRIAINDLESPLDRSVKSFLTCWRIFSLSHDLGYVLEREISEEGKIKSNKEEIKECIQKINDLQDEIIYDIILRSLARTLYAKAVLESSSSNSLSTTFTVSSILEEGNWKTLFDPGVTLKKFSDKYDELFQGYIKINSVDSYRGLKHFSSFIPFQKVLTLVKDKDLRIVAVHFYYEGKRIVYYKPEVPFSEIELKNINLLGSEELPKNEYSCVYYIPSQCQVNSKYKESQLDEYIDYIDDAKKVMYQALSRVFSLVKDDLTTEDSLFDVYMWLRENVSLSYMKKKTPDFDMGHILSESRTILSKQIQGLIDSVDFDDSGIKNDISAVLAYLRINLANSDALISDINIQINKEHSEESMSPMKVGIREYFRHLFPKIRNSLGNFPSALVKFDGNAVSFLDGEIYISGLDERLVQKAKDLNIDYSALMKYHNTEFCSFDHGIVSAVLDLITFDIYSKIIDNIDKLKILSLAWPVDRMNLHSAIMEKDQDLIADAVFAIMLHNVSVRTEKNAGIEYMQDISVNPFSYFCAFCDNLQLWDRRKLINPAYTKLPGSRYYSEEFDVVIEDSKVRIFCRTSDIWELISKKRNALNTYLKDAAFLIDVTVAEHGNSLN